MQFERWFVKQELEEDGDLKFVVPPRPSTRKSLPKPVPPPRPSRSAQNIAADFHEAPREMKEKMLQKIWTRADKVRGNDVTWLTRLC